MRGSPRLAAGFVAVILVFTVFLTWAADHISGLFKRKPDFPDFSHYYFLRTLSADEFPIQADHDRIIAVGDIHGMNHSLSALLTKVSYDPESDTLIHLGDIITKGPLKGSIAVLSFMADHNIMGIRGNNDQTVIEWRAWRDWIQSLPGGPEWLDSIDDQFLLDDDTEESHPSQEFWARGANKDWEYRIPKGWKLFGRHHKVARAMTQEHYDYLRSLPVVMHAPTGHTFFVHAGILAADPNRDLMHPRQPLSHWPTMRTSKPKPHILRSLQEAAILRDIPQNKDPWVLLNMRTVKKDGSISRKKKGIPWPKLWNNIMNMCEGVNLDLSSSPESQYPLLGAEREEDELEKSLPCFPSTIVYGHIASRGLDVRRWSVGLDSGCVRRRQLSALVLDKGSFLNLDHNEDFGRSSDTVSEDSPIKLKYGDHGRAHIVSIQC